MRPIQSHFEVLSLTLALALTVLTLPSSGRIRAKREKSKKLIFYDLYSDGQTVQIMSSARRYVQSEAHDGEDEFSFMNKLLKRGDIIGNYEDLFSPRTT